jgi:hypothetical protein
MGTADKTIAVYQELADWHDRHQQTQLRDRFLVLAADAAQSAGSFRQAEQLRQVLLQLNPAHMLKLHKSFAEAVRSADVRTLLADLRQSYPPSAAGDLLKSLQAEQGGDGVEPPVATLASPPVAKQADVAQPVYQLKDDVPAATRRIAGAVPLAMPAAHRPAAPVLTPSIYRPEPEPPLRAGAKAERTGERNRDRLAANWLASALFVLVLVSGLALAFYTLVWPLLR